MAKEKKEVLEARKTPLIQMLEDTNESQPLEAQEISEINEIMLDLKFKSLFFYKVLDIYNKYIINYIYKYLDTTFKDSIRDYIHNYLENSSSLLVFRKDEIVREGKPLKKNRLKVSLEPKVILEGLCKKYPTLDLELEFDKWNDYILAHGKTYRNHKAAFRNWCRNAVEYQAKNGHITPQKVTTYKEMFDDGNT